MTRHYYYLAKEVGTFYPALVCPSVCHQLYVKATGWIFMQSLLEMYLWTRIAPLNSGSCLVLDSSILQDNIFVHSMSHLCNAPRHTDHGKPHQLAVQNSAFASGTTLAKLRVYALQVLISIVLLL